MRKLLLSTILFFCLCQNSFSATLLQYTIPAGDPYNPSATASNITGGTLTNASLSLFTNNNSLGYATDPVLQVAPPNSTTTAALAVTNNSYFSFSITPDANYQMDFTSLTFTCARGGASTPRGYVVRSSIDSYAANIDTAAISTQRTTWTNVSIDLTGASYQDLTSAVTFRIYTYAPTSSTSVEYDTIAVDGTVSLLSTDTTIYGATIYGATIY